MHPCLYLLNTTFLWEGKEYLKHSLILDEEFVSKNNIKKVGVAELILIFEHYYGLDIGNYGLRDFIVHQDKPNLTIHLKSIDEVRQIQLLNLGI
jgi:hypothetical protein